MRERQPGVVDAPPEGLTLVVERNIEALLKHRRTEKESPKIARCR